MKLGLMKQFVKALDKDGDCFQYICKSFPSLSNGKLKDGIFDGPQIRQLIRDQKIFWLYESSAVSCMVIICRGC